MLYSLCLTLLQQEVQLEHTRKQHVVPHETSVPERHFSPVQVSLQKAKNRLRLDPCATLNPVTLILSKSENPAFMEDFHASARSGARTHGH